ncbi:MAG: ParB/RepB/Spo0J family partition protein [Bacteroidales bacterium]|nr:ParB/RepB/Spo0J family partition protein [Bacteroidales bacterium]
MAKRHDLGRGLGALISTEEVQTVGSSSISEIPLSQIHPNPNQPRQEFEAEALEELAASIRQLGIIQPITLRKISEGNYQIISGERRYRASKSIGLENIPAYIKTTEDEQVMEMALIENIQREDLNAIEVALAYQKLLEVYNLTHEKLSERLGKKRATITNYLRLLKLPAIIQIGLKDKKIEMGHARALAGIEDSQWQLALYDDIVKHGLSVRKVEEIIKTNSPEALARKQSDKQAKKKAQLEYAELQKLLSEKLGTRVKLNIDTKGKGSISIPFKSEKKLEEILACLDRI